MLGRAILPAFAVETTAIVCEIKWGPEPKAILHRIEGGYDEVPISELEREIVVVHDAEPKYLKAEIYWPLDLCREGIVMIDSPGLNASMLSERITTEYLGRADAVVYVLDCQQLVLASELLVIEDIRAAGHDDIFFVCNKINKVRNETESTKVRAVGSATLGPLTKFGTRRIFYVNAWGVLDSRQAESEPSDGEFLRFEHDLAQFLTVDSGRVKLLHAAAELKNHALAATQAARELIGLRSLDGSEVARRYASAEEALSLIEAERDTAIARLNLHLADAERAVVESASAKLATIVEGLPARANEHQLEHRVTAMWSLPKLRQQAQDVAREVGDVLNGYVRRELVDWQNQTLKPLLAERVTTIAADVRGRTETILEALERIHRDLNAGTAPEQAESPRTASAFDPAVSLGLGLLLVDIGAAGIGTTLAFTDLVRNIAPGLGLALAGAMLIGPFVLVPIVLAALTLRYDTLNERIKAGVCAHLVAHVRENATASALATGRAVGEELAKIRDRWKDKIQIEIDGVQVQTATARTARDDDQATVEERIAALRNVIRTVDAIAADLDDLIVEFLLRYSSGAAESG